MHKLDRSACRPPQCLAVYEYRTQVWRDVLEQHKIELGAHLEEMQGRRCAYCEGDLSALGKHIEHFRRRKDFPRLTFSWLNLFWSCDKNDSCGHFKDNGAGAYNPDDLINPCDHDPEDFFNFRSDGTISIRQGLSNEDAHKARETIRVFSLDAKSGRLRFMRQTAVAGYVSLVDEASSEGWSTGEIAELF